MRNLLVLGFVSIGLLAGCGGSVAKDTEKSFYKEVIMNGEVISSDANEKGDVYSVVKYQNKLYKCFAGWHNWCTEQ